VILRRPPTPFRHEYSHRREELERRLSSSIAVVSSILFSPAWGRREELVGTLSDGRLQLRVRHGYSNGFTRIFHGTLTSTPRGARIEGEFRTLWWVVAIMRTVALFFVASVLLERRAAPFALFMVALLAGIEAVARRMGDRDEEKMREFLTRSL
jgi:hypothetical protein